MKKKVQKKLSPRKAIKLKDVITLKSDNRSVKDGWILIDGDRVVIYNQRLGEEPTGKVGFNRKQFNALIDWYNTEQTTVAR